jgi:hypothetical protein
MSVSADFSSLNMTNTTLAKIDYYFQGCILPIIILFGVIGNISNIYIFTRSSLYCSCSIYFFAGAVNGLVLLLFGTTSRWLGHTFPGLDATTFSLFFCRFRNYLVNIIYDLAPYFIACVTIDRFCSSSADVSIRRLSARPQTAYIVTIITTLTTFVAYIHNLIYYTIIDSLCQSNPGFYSQFFSIFTTVYYFTAVILIIIFGLGTVYHVRAQRKKIQSMTIRLNQKDRRRLRNDGQLLWILFVHITFYVCFAMPYHITLIIAAIKPSISKIPSFLFIQHVAIVALNFNQAVSN